MSIAQMIAGLETPSPSTDVWARGCIHVPTPGDHYSPATGSAVMTVIYEMNRVAALNDKHAAILVSRGTRHDYTVGRCIEIDAAANTPKILRAADIALGRTGLSRRFTQRSYAPSIFAVDPNFDGVLFLHNCPAVVGQFRRRCPHAMICLWAHNELFRTFSARETRQVVQTCDRVICVSRYIANELRNRCGDDSGKICVVHNGVDIARFRPAPHLQSVELPIVLFVGRVIPEKGPDLLLQAAAKLHATGRKFRVRIVGSSGFSADDPLTPYERELRKVAEPMGDLVEFQSFVDREKVLREYQSASIFCAPATWNEPVSLTVSEAMACGLPTIASRRGGIPEIGGDAVLYFQPPDVDALAQHLAMLLDDRAARHTWGSKARVQAESISWEKQYCVLSQSMDTLHPPGRDAHVGRDIVFVSMEQWDEIWRRNQFLCAAYATRHPDRKVLFVAPPIDLTNAVRKGRLCEFRGPRTWVVPEYPNITVTRPLKIAPSTFALGRRLNDCLARSHVNKVARSMGITAPILWLNPHWAAHMAGKMGEAAVIYDVTDDWAALTQGASSTELVLQQDAELCRKADAVIVCSQRLFDLKRPTARRLHLIPNGVDAEHYQMVLGSENLAQDPKWRRPVLGYTGTLHPDRVDVDLLAAIARKWKGSIILIGPNQLRPADLEKLDVPNIILTGAVPYSRLPGLMRGFDVCIVPHRVTPFTESLNPIKLWEYLAAGKPIVSTNVAGFRDFPQFVRLAHDAEEFANAASQCMSESASLPLMRRVEARRHSWQSRLDQVEMVIEQCILSCRSSS